MRSDLVAQIDIDRLLHNFRALRALAPGAKFCAPLKANAYGHDVRIVAPVLQDAGADWAAVATIQEAVELREIGWRRPLLLLGNMLAVHDEAERRERIDAAVRNHLTLTVADGPGVALLSQNRESRPVDVHLKIDTGMGRMGAVPADAAALIKQVRDAPKLRLTGIYSHFATADFELPDLARQQLIQFQSLLAELRDLLPHGVVRHIANSAATITMPEAHFDMVRPGLALYGYWPARHMSGQIELKPILRLVSHVSLIKELPAGHCVGYGRTFTTRRKTRLGIVPVGYFDGYLRALSNNSVVTVSGLSAPVIGRVSMDQLAIDLTDIPTAQLGDTAILIDDRPEKANCVAAIAERLGTIPYEVTCLLGSRIERISVQTGRGRFDPPS